MRYKKGIYILVLALIILTSSNLVLAENNENITMYFFWSENCPYCQTQKEYVDEWKINYPEIEIKELKMWEIPENVELFEKLAGEFNINVRVVPTTIIGDKHWIGFTKIMAHDMEKQIQRCIEYGCTQKIKYSDFYYEKNETCIHAFLESGCPQCQDLIPFLIDLEEKYDIEIVQYDVNEERDKILLKEFMDIYGLKVELYPTLFIGERYIVGEEPIRKTIETEIENCLEKGCPCPIKKIRPYTTITAKPSDVTPSESQTINFFGKDINVGDMPLLFSTFIISFIDGFNPCSLWVITFLLGIVILTGSRKKIIIIGLTYLTVAAAAYGVFILGLISVFTYIGYLIWIRILVAAIAIMFALVNIKDFFWYKKGISFTIPDKYKPKIFKRVRDLLKPENNLKTLVMGSAVLALGITLVELPCTAGFPMIWSNIIAAHKVDLSFFILLFLIYILIYFMIELAIFFSIVITLKASKFEKKHGRLLKLIGGIIMLALALVLLFNPDLLNNVSGTILIFGGAIILSLIIAAIYKRIHGSLEEDSENNKFNKLKKTNNKKEDKKNEFA